MRSRIVLLVLAVAVLPIQVFAQGSAILDMTRWRHLDVGEKLLAPAWRDQRTTSVATDGIGFFAVWVDYRKDGPPSPPENPIGGLFGTSIDVSGTLRPEAGIDLGLYVYGDVTRIVWNGSAYAVFARTPDGWVAGELSRDGTWIRQPRRIFEGDETYRANVNVTGVDDGYVVVSSTENRVPSTYQITVAKLSLDFSTVRPEVEIASRRGAWVRLALARRNDDVLLAWLDGSGRTIDWMHLAPDASAASSLVTQPASTSIFTDISAISTSAGYLVAWGDSARCQVALIDATGFHIAGAELPIGTDAPQLAWTGSSAIVAFNGIGSSSPYDTDVYAAALDGSGNRVTAVVPISKTYGGQNVSSVAATPEASLIAWNDTRDGNNVFGAVEGAALQALPREFLVAESLHAQLEPHLAHNGTANFVVWLEGANRMGAIGDIVDANGRSTGTASTLQNRMVTSIAGVANGFVVLSRDASGTALARVTNSGTVVDPEPIPVVAASVWSGSDDNVLVLSSNTARIFHSSDGTLTDPTSFDPDVTFTGATWTGERFAVAGTKVYFGPCNPHCSMPGYGIVLQAVDANANAVGEEVALPGGGLIAESAIASSNSRVVVAYSTSPGRSDYQGEFDVVEVDPQSFEIRRTIQVIRSGFCGDSCLGAYDIKIAPVGNGWFLSWAWNRSDSYYHILSREHSAAVIGSDFTLHEVNMDSSASQWLGYDLDVWNGRVVIAASFPGETEVPRVRLLMELRNRPRGISR